MSRPFDPAIFDPYIFDTSEFVSVGTTPVIEVYDVKKGRKVVHMHELIQGLTAAGQASQGLRCSGTVTVHIAGDAVAVTGVVERSTGDPNRSPNWQKQGGVITGNPAGAGIPVKAYKEPARAWWRFRLTEITDGVIDASISGTLA